MHFNRGCDDKEGNNDRLGMIDYIYIYLHMIAYAHDELVGELNPRKLESQVLIIESQVLPGVSKNRWYQIRM